MLSSNIDPSSCSATHQDAIFATGVVRPTGSSSGSIPNQRCGLTQCSRLEFLHFAPSPRSHEGRGFSAPPFLSPKRGRAKCRNSTGCRRPKGLGQPIAMLFPNRSTGFVARADDRPITAASLPCISWRWPSVAWRSRGYPEPLAPGGHSPCSACRPPSARRSR